MTGAVAKTHHQGRSHRRGLTALFWSDVNPYGTFRLDMNKRLDLMPAYTARDHAKVGDRGA
ncbi:hypothetical protein [Streptomyces mayteni]